MNKVNTLKLSGPDYPDILRNIHKPPGQLYFIGQKPEQWLDKPKVAIVGSRKATSYGLSVTDDIARQLSKLGVVIISGLAFGVDAAAHKAAVAVGGQTVAVLPTSLENIYPATHLNLARQITENGALISEYGPGDPVHKSNFTARNRIVSGLADAVLITEAAINSGSLHTARHALEQGKVVLAVPGNINSPTSIGCNNLIKSGALPVTEAGDVLFALGYNPESKKQKVFRGSDIEGLVLDLINQGVSDQEEIALKSQLDGPAISSILITLELLGHVRPAGAGQWMPY